MDSVIQKRRGKPSGAFLMDISCIPTVKFGGMRDKNPSCCSFANLPPDTLYVHAITIASRILFALYKECSKNSNSYYCLLDGYGHSAIGSE